jgi:drug/metabolite transporter (DMT)-like permease
VGFGTWFVLLDVAAERHELWALVASRAAASLLIGSLAIVLARHHPAPAGGWNRVAPIIGLAGVLDVAGNAAFVLATTTVPIGIAAALSGLYPVVTLLLSWVVLRDRLPPLAIAAVILAVGGTASSRSADAPARLILCGRRPATRRRTTRGAPTPL